VGIQFRQSMRVWHGGVFIDGGHRREGYLSMYDLKRVDGMGKVDLALDVTQGLEDMHEHDVLHADIQAKQFLLDPVGGVNLNDFNRCEGVSCEDTVCAWGAAIARGV